MAASLHASSAPAVLAGTRVQTLAYNGSVPGPTLRLKAGETLQLAFTNNLDTQGRSRVRAASEAAPGWCLPVPAGLVLSGGHTVNPDMTNLHLHGPLIAPATDNPFLLLEPGQTRTIEVPLPATSEGTHWYYPHPHGQVAPQLDRGLSGALIVAGALDDELGDWEDHLLVLKDFTLKNGAVDGYYGTQRRIGKGGELFTVNGQLRPILKAKQSGLRLRFLNASTARPYFLTLGDQPLHLIATDGHTLEKPVELQELLLAPGQRADVLVTLAAAGTYHLRALPYKALTVSTKVETTLLTVQSPGTPVPRLPTFLTQIERLDAQDSVVTRTLDFTFTSGLFGSNYQFRINGLTFDHARTDLTARLGTQETWQIENHHSWDLPFHLHSYPFQISERRIDKVWRPEPYRAWRDTVNIDQGDAVRLLIPFRHYAGKTVYHCHIVEHEDHGMMGVLDVKS